MSIENEINMNIKMNELNYKININIKINELNNETDINWKSFIFQFSLFITLKIRLSELQLWIILIKSFKLFIFNDIDILKTIILL